MRTRDKTREKDAFAFLLLYIMLFTQLALLFSLATENTGIERACSYILLLTVFAQFGLSFAYERMNTRQDMVLLIFVAFLSLVLMYHGLQYDHLVAILTFLTMVMVWRTSKTIRYDLRINTIIGSFFMIQGLILVWLYFSPLAYKAYAEGTAKSDVLTLGFANPNQTGTILFSTIAILLLTSLDETRKARKTFMRLECVALSYFLVLTDARTSMVALMFFVWFLMTKRTLRKRLVLADAIFLGQVPFVFIYNRLAETELTNVMFLGKRIISGRQYVYAEALRIWTNKLVGNLDRHLLANAHNAALTVLVDLGLIGYVLYTFYTLGSFNQLYRQCHTKRQMSGIIVLIAFFLMGWAEAAVLTGGTFYYVHMFVIMALTGQASDTDLDESENRPKENRPKYAPYYARRRG